VKILLEECVDRRLAKDIEGHEVVTVPQAGFLATQPRLAAAMNERRVVALADEGCAHPALAVMRWTLSAVPRGTIVSLHLADYRNGAAGGRCFLPFVLTPQPSLCAHPFQPRPERGFPICRRHWSLTGHGRLTGVHKFDAPYSARREPRARAQT
jgi:hypothetical protein